MKGKVNKEIEISVFKLILVNPDRSRKELL